MAAGCYWSVADKVREDVLDGDHKFVGHACEFETSLMMHLRPELVDDSSIVAAGDLVDDVIEGLYVSRDMKQRTRLGHTGRPDLATAEKGRHLFDSITEGLAVATEKLLEQRLGMIYDDFF